MDDLATIVKNTISTTIASKSFVFEKITQPTAIQQRAIDVIGISMIFTQSSWALNLCKFHYG
ncbi:Mobile element protein [Richelia intracellularis]|nr:Mobile element protein [Richelia intracellularis]